MVEQEKPKFNSGRAKVVWSNPNPATYQQLTELCSGLMVLSYNLYSTTIGLEEVLSGLNGHKALKKQVKEAMEKAYDYFPSD